MKILKLLLPLSILLIVGCGKKIPFKEQDTLKNSALVYVYAKQTTSNEDDVILGKYMLRVNDKTIGIVLEEGEYTPIDLKPSSSTLLSATKGALITKDITLDLKAGDIYYLRAVSKSGGDFTFTKLDSSKALPELRKTVLFGSDAEDENEVLIKKDENKQIDKEIAPSQSKSQKIRDAHLLKKDGIITQEEFEKLKAEIFAQ